MSDPFQSKSRLTAASATLSYSSLKSLEAAGLGSMQRLPYSIRVLLESALRNLDDYTVREDDVRALAGWSRETVGEVEVPFLPGRVVLQDFTGVSRGAFFLGALRAPRETESAAPPTLSGSHNPQPNAVGKSG